MNLDNIKNLIEKDGGKFIIVENGKPCLVVMGFKDYEKVINGYKNNPFEQADLMVEQEKESNGFSEGAGLEGDMDPLEKRQDGLNEQQAEKEELEGLSEEGRNFLDMPIQGEDKDAELDDLPLR